MKDYYCRVENVVVVVAAAADPPADVDTVAFAAIGIRIVVAIWMVMEDGPTMRNTSERSSARNKRTPEPE